MKEDQDQVHYPFSTIPHDTSSLTYPILQNSQQNLRATHREQLSQLQQSQGQDASDQFSISGGSSVQFYFNTEVAVEQSLRHRQAQGDHTHGLPAKWMSSKMRLMRKMMGDERILVSKKGGQALRDQSQPNHECSSSSSNGNNSPTGIIRVCSNCSTTKTPLWRSGPQGPKSLCNACGIRQMKARRAMRAAAAISGGLVPAGAPKKVRKEERPDVDRTVPFKKRFKIATSTTAQKKHRFDDITINLSKKLACHQTFPQEEKDAAILLMALSCGLIHG